MKDIENMLFNQLPNLSKLMDFLVALLSVSLLRSKQNQNNTNQLIKELIEQLQEKGRDNIRLQMEIRAWKKHYSRLGYSRTSKKLDS